MNKTALKPSFWIFLLAFTSLFACDLKENSYTEYKYPVDSLLEGDIVFRRGTGIVSQVVLTVDKKGNYSHIGIVVRDNSEWKVVHAVPSEPDFKDDPDRIKMENIYSFFDVEKAKTGAVMRVRCDSEKRIKASKRAIELFHRHILFDHQYDLADSSKMYCTELVDFVFKHEGIDLTEGRINNVNVPGFNGEYLFPSDIYKSKELDFIYNF